MRLGNMHKAFFADGGSRGRSTASSSSNTVRSRADSPCCLSSNPFETKASLQHVRVRICWMALDTTCHCGRSRHAPNTPNPLPSHLYTQSPVNPTQPPMYGPACHCGWSRLTTNTPFSLPSLSIPDPSHLHC